MNSTRKSRFKFPLGLVKVSQNIHLNLQTITSLQFTEVLFVHLSSMELNITYRKIVKKVWRKNCRDSHWTWVCFFLFFQKYTCAFFFLVVVRLWQMLVKNVSKFVWKYFKSPLSLHKQNYFGEVSLFNLNYLCFNCHLLAQNCTVQGGSYCNYNPKLFGFFWQEFVKFWKKVKTLFISLGRFALGKTDSSVLSTQDLGHRFSQHGPWHITSAIWCK